MPEPRLNSTFHKTDFHKTEREMVGGGGGPNARAGYVENKTTCGRLSLHKQVGAS